jgi:hypothetical protein
VIVNTDPGSQVPLIVGVLSLVMSQFVGLAIDGTLGTVESITTGRESGRDIFPAGSTAVTVRLLAHSGSGVVGVNVQFPDISTSAVPRVVPDASLITTVLPGSAVPTIVGVVSLVRYVGVVSPATLDTIGDAGRRESIVNTVAVGALVFPAVSVRMTEKVFDHSGSGVVGVKLYDPVGDTTPVPMTVSEAFLTVNILLGSPVPVRVGVVSLVRELLAGVVMPGATGTVVSTTNVVALGVLVFPAVSMRVTEKVLDPSGSGVVGVKLYDPVGDTTPVPMTVPEAFLTVNILLGSPVPVRVGVLVARSDPESGDAMVGAPGAIVSIVNVVVAGILSP